MTENEFLEKINKVYSRCSELDELTLFKYASKIPENGIIVDIGTFFGSSAFSMAMGSPTASVYTIDPNTDEKFFVLRKEFGLDDRVEFIHKTSEDAGKDWDKPIDMLFIDGIHTDDGVTNDLKWFGTHVKRGGYILAHDYYLYNGIEWAIKKAINDEFMEEVEIIKSFDTHDKDKRTIGLFIGRKL